MPSSVPPRWLPVFTNSAYHSWSAAFAGLIWLLRAKMLRAPPEHSLPTQIAPRLENLKTQSSITMFSDATPTRRPSTSRPDLIAMQSSPVSNVTFWICTSEQHSGSHPSLLPPPLRVWRLSRRTVMFLDSTGCTHHIGGRTAVKSSSRMLVHDWNSIRLGRSLCPLP